MATLYRKHRPQNWKEVVGQNNIKITITHEIKANQVSHAYLFCGPRGVGKTTFARVLAKSINCSERKDGDFEPCNKCSSCLDIVASKSLDIIEVDAASHTGVDNVRENIIAAARIAPSRDKSKVFIIDEVHMLSISAFNALLKVLEEPPQGVVFILCTTEVHKIPATIISRCQRFDFKRISVTDIVKKLSYITNQEKIKINKNVLEAIARRSEGHMRDAESILGQIIAIGGDEITEEEADLVIPRSDMNEVLNLLGNIAKKDASNAISLVNKIIDEGIDLKQFMSDTLMVLRKLMIIKINPGLVDKLGIEMGENLELRINQISQEISLNNIIYYIERLHTARQEIRNSFIVQLPLELAIAEICTSSTPGATPPAAEPKKPTTTEAPTQISTKVPLRSNINGLNKEEIIAKWHEVLAKIKHHNHSLSFILRVCQPRDLKGNQLCLAFKYKFHKDRINEVNIKKIVEKIMRDVYGQDLQIEAIIDENMEVSHTNGQPEANKNLEQNPKPATTESGQNNNDTINNILKTFGGKVVD